jgi:hypothetical protein
VSLDFARDAVLSERSPMMEWSRRNRRNSACYWGLVSVSMFLPFHSLISKAWANFLPKHVTRFGGIRFPILFRGKCQSPVQRWRGQPQVLVSHFKRTNPSNWSGHSNCCVVQQVAMAEAPFKLLSNLLRYATGRRRRAMPYRHHVGHVGLYPTSCRACRL